MHLISFGIYGLLVTATHAALVDFYVISPESRVVQVSVGGALTTLKPVAPNIPLYTGSVETGKATTYSYLTESEEEVFVRTLPSGASRTLNDFFGRPITYANITDLPRPLDNGKHWTRADKNPDLFDTNYIPTIVVNGETRDMERLVKTVPKKKFRVELTIIGKDYYRTFKNVKFSITGAGKVNNPAKQSWRWTFDKGDTINHRNNFKIRHMEEDPTQMREKLYADCLRAMGTYANQANMVRLFINGKGFGTFNMLDDIPKYSYINANFYGGNPPKEMGPLYNGATGAGFQLLEEDEYTMFKVTKGSPEDESSIQSLAKAFVALNVTDDAALNQFDQDVFDVDQFMRFMVMEYLGGHWDGYWMMQTNDGAFKDYTENGRWYYLGHDYDATFGVNLEKDILNHSYREFPVRYPDAVFINGFLKNQKFRTKFESYITETVKVLFNKRILGERIWAYHQFIAPELEWDSTISQKSPGKHYGWFFEQTRENLYRKVTSPGAGGGGADYGLLDWIEKKSEFVAKDLNFAL
ncbi:coth protein-domain-containing protein [Sporodiniella umbellata]|nr:coth protein-domain-containing protein [Sporodiniella umbellata]